MIDPRQVVEAFGRDSVLREYLAREERKRKLRVELHGRYPPTDRNVAFHANQARRRSLRGGNQVGKTKAGAREALYRMLGVHPHYPTRAPPVHLRVVTYSFKQSRIVQRALFELCPKAEIVPECTFDSDRGFKHAILRLRNGSTCEVTTAGQSTLAHAGDTLDGVWCDEPPKPSHYSELLARLLAREGDLWLTYTPIGRPVEWLRDEVKAGRIDDTLIRLTVEDCPFYTQEQIDDIGGVYLPAEYDQRVNGAWEGVTTGRVFTGFHERETLIDTIPDLDFALVIGIDHGERSGKEVAIVLGVVGEAANAILYVLGEYVSPGNTTPDVDAAGIADVLAGYGWSALDVRYARGDVNTAGKLGAGYTINALMERGFAKAAGLARPPFRIQIPDKGKNSVVAGCRVVNHALLDRRLFVHRSCTSLIKSLRHWTGLNDDLKDAIDALRYIAVDFLRDSTRADRLVIRS